MVGEEEGREEGGWWERGKEGEERGWKERRKEEEEGGWWERGEGRGGERMAGEEEGKEDTLTYSSIALFLTCSHDIENDAHAPAVYSLPVSPHSRSLEYLWCEVAGGATQSLHQ